MSQDEEHLKYPQASNEKMYDTHPVMTFGDQFGQLSPNDVRQSMKSENCNKSNSIPRSDNPLNDLPSSSERHTHFPVEEVKGGLSLSSIRPHDDETAVQSSRNQTDQHYFASDDNHNKHLAEEVAMHFQNRKNSAPEIESESAAQLKQSLDLQRISFPPLTSRNN